MPPFAAPAAPGFRAPAASPPAPVTPTAAVPEAPAPSVTPPPVPVIPPRPSGSNTAVPPAGAPADGVARRVINPFLANDPNQKAKRLARALVSDMVAYLPQKREEGLKNGTLKTLFREEIKKSYEEYVDQIGKEFADSTTHFQDALNEILAGGKKMF